MVTDTPRPNDVSDVAPPLDASDVTPPPPDAPPDATPPPPDVTPPPPDATPDAMPPRPARTNQTYGAAVAISGNDRVAVMANRTAGTVSVFNLTLAGTPPTASRTANVSTGPNSEPWAAVIGNDNDTAFVVLRRERAVVRIDNLSTTPTAFATRASTGSEPTGIAIAPSGRTLYVANWAEGTVTVVNAADMTVAATIDLNPSLVATGSLGASAMARAGLAHPRAIVITNNGDVNDDDETAYVTEFFSQARTSGVPTDDSQFDLGRQGVVYRFNLGTRAASPAITLAPVADTGFRDSADAVTGCFPNELYAAALNANRLYVTAVCESPRGPTGPVGTNVNNFKTQVHTALFVVDTMTNTELPAQRVMLPQRFQALYDGASVPDDATRRVPLIAHDLAFVPMSNIAYVPSYGTDAVFRVRFNPDGTVAEVGSSTNRFINLNPGGGIAAGRLPVGIAVGNTASGVALVANENTRNLSIVTFATQSVVGAVQGADAPAAGSADERVNEGRRFFVTGLGRWSLRGQGWNSCETCHPDGLTDNVTWFFARGPRQTTSLDGTYSPDGTQRRLLNWTAIFDEVDDFELNTRGNSGGVGAIVHTTSAPAVAGDRIIFDGTAVTAPQVGTATPQAGLNGSAAAITNPGVPAATPPGGTVRSSLDDWTRIDAYVRTIRSPRGLVSPALAVDVAAGRTLFEMHNCAGCHGGASWTASRVFYTPNATNNAAMGLLRTTTYALPAGYPAILNPPANGAPAPLRFTNADPAVVGANDQINCILRNVGTIEPPATPGGVPGGVAPAGVTVREVRANMTTPAQGLTGFNPPSLFGMTTGAPYFHAGNARTLEEAFDARFRAHYQAHSSNFLDTGDRATQVRQLVAFLLTIDDDTMTVARPASIPALCPDSL